MTRRHGRVQGSVLHAILLAASLALPLVEVPSAKNTSDTFVVIVSGDGGWAAIDKTIAHVLAENGMPVVGLNALQYFWTKRTPETAGHDLQSIIETYGARWHKSRVIVVGYSRGADVLPAMINRMPAATQSKIRLIALLGPSPTVEFEFHVSDWLRDKKRGMAVRPELERIRDRKVLCLWGEDDNDSLCRHLEQTNVRVVTLKGAHHFDGGYEKLARIILDAAE
jgi:type IV secretory pathway VirJ component